MTVAAVVPTLNESPTIRPQLESLIDLVDEVVVADGGSDDDTVQIATEMGTICVAAPRGRGPQMNRGATATRADILIFVHADTRLPQEAPRLVRQAVSRGSVGGGFLARFDSDRPLFRLGSTLVNLRTRLTRLPLGDQAQFAERRAFDRLQGFREWPILEDLDFMRRLRRLGPTTILHSAVITSARRYEQAGVARTIANNWLIWLLFALGVSPERLSERYRDLR